MFFISIFTLAIQLSLAEESSVDPHLWLEGVEDQKALDWVIERNTASTNTIASSDGFSELENRLLSVYDSTERIPYVYKQGDAYYNFWRDGDHPRGLWRRTSLNSFKTDTPSWEIVLDLDALAEAENENWVWHGAQCLPPAETTCMVALSRGGADADIKREFDTETKTFIENGFFLPEAKSRISWVNPDQLLVGTDFGEGTLTDSGYPKISKLWLRGTELSSAETIMEGNQSDISVSASRDHTPNFEHTMVYQGLTFYTNRVFLETKKGLVQLEKQDSAQLNLWKGNVLIELREDWDVDGTSYKAGSLLAAPLKKWLKGKKNISILFEPDTQSSLLTYTTTRDHLIVTVLNDVKTELFVLTQGKKNHWTESKIEGLPTMGQLRIWPDDSNKTNDYWLTVRDFVTPDTLYMGGLNSGKPIALKSLPAFFDSKGLDVSQHFATSKDGTKVPYFEVSNTEKGDSTPTLLYGYGGFEISLLPRYSSSVGISWLEKGGTYVVANIRGGGEYGPTWHQAALKENRHRAYEDFVAVGEDLVKRGVTTPSQLGIQGGSNGGLLMGNMYTLYPEKFGAIVCQVPLLDMKRYTKLLAGASWAGEYGDPDIPEQWDYIQTFSPYHNIDVDTDYPPMLITTSTRDDRVHPAHARKMTAALEAANKNVLYYENMEGGHGGSANNKQAAFMSTLAYTFLWDTLTQVNETEEETNIEIETVE
jgi:prolyl oligopeptidase